MGLTTYQSIVQRRRPYNCARLLGAHHLNEERPLAADPRLGFARDPTSLAKRDDLLLLHHLLHGLLLHALLHRAGLGLHHLLHRHGCGVVVSSRKRRDT